MSQFTKFMKTNKKVRENGFYAPTKSLCDEDGKPLEWEFRHITSGENESIREECTIEVQVKGKPNLYRPRVQTGKYIRKMIVESVVVPDLLDRELIQSALNGGTGKPQFCGDCPYPRPAFAFFVRVILEVHIHRSGPVAQVGLVDLFKITHRYRSSTSVRRLAAADCSWRIRLFWA